MEVVQNIDNYCAVSGITIKEFERLCGLANALVSKWRSGRQTPTIKTLKKISDATGISIDAWIKENGV